MIKKGRLYPKKEGLLFAFRKNGTIYRFSNVIDVKEIFLH
jgi:hypothetical protein